MRTHQFIALIAIVAFFALLHLPAPQSPAQPPGVTLAPAAYQLPSTAALPVPGDWTSGQKIDAMRESKVYYKGETNTQAAAAWQLFFGDQLLITDRPAEAYARNRTYWHPRDWFVAATAQAQELPQPPGADSSSTLADSMYARWVIQRHIATQLDTLITDGLTVTTAADPAQTALLTEIAASLKTLVERPASTGGGITPEQLQALVDSVKGVGGAVEALGDELESTLGGSVSPPSDPSP